MAQKRTRQRQLALWILVNLIIFIACYLNYRLQLKHRYLYRILNAGLCFSRAAAMVINFNLMLVWLPMCKYSLTRLACIAIGTLRHYRQRLAQLTRISHVDQQQQQLQLQVDSQHHDQQQVVVIAKFEQPGLPAKQKMDSSPYSSPSKTLLLYRKFITSVALAWRQLDIWFLTARINSLSSFLTAVDHCKSMHTICATTITVASVIHTVAHLINVIKFSNNYNPLMSNLNMAEYKGQNPFQLLISVPGITGSLMIIILILMSLSSVDIIRNSSYDLFQIFHRLSIVFVLLLLLHPSSHVLKEQSNVDRHHPDLCFNRTDRLNSTANTVPVPALDEQSAPVRPSTALAGVGDDTLKRLRRDIARNITSSKENANRTIDLNNIAETSNTQSRVVDLHAHLATYIENDTIVGEDLLGLSSRKVNITNAKEIESHLCLDPLPLFVAQSSICWYVLCIGLSCYLFDLLLRKWRRSKSSIELLDIRLDCEGSLIELILSNNHKRFNYWLPGQFVYLNCPQIAACEWHPFTISSMDNENRQFTLHIKTGGDWTRKLREKLEYMQISMSFLQQNLHLSLPLETKHQKMGYAKFETIGAAGNVQLEDPILSLPSLDCCCNKTGQLQIECTKMVRVKYETEQQNFAYNCCADDDSRKSVCDVTSSDASSHRRNNYDDSNNNKLYSISFKTSENVRDIKILLESGLDLYIDGPFHSPFDRLLEQQVSVCVANGVGWTAFSSIFQCITNNFLRLSDKSSIASDCWWTQWKKFAVANRVRDYGRTRTRANVLAKIGQLPDTRLHLMVIVTSIEQMKPFYYLALNYFKKIQEECQIEMGSHLNPVREITAFITRCSHEDQSVKEFCRQENLSTLYEHRTIRANDLFTIHFGKPKFDAYLSNFRIIYPSSKKISVYCCGSNQVKKDVREICQSLNKLDKLCITTSQTIALSPYYSYHEENF